MMYALQERNSNAMSRTTTFDPKYLPLVSEYLQQCKDEEYNFHKTRGLNSNTYVEKIRVRLPSIDGFARYIGVTRATIYNWADENTEFAEAIEEISIEQKVRLIDRGLDGSYNPVMAKMLLSANHGMREGIDTTTNGKEISGNAIVFTDFSHDEAAS